MDVPKINDPDVPFKSTWYVGHIFADYNGLVRVLGEPLGPSGDDKVDAEWVLDWPDGTRATIYNWKNGPSYVGGPQLDLEKIERWHVGGESTVSLRRVMALLEVRGGAD